MSLPLYLLVVYILKKKFLYAIGEHIGIFRKSHNVFIDVIQSGLCFSLSKCYFFLTFHLKFLGK